MSIERPNEVQPIDDHVRRLLERARDKLHVDVDPENATRMQRVRAAIAFEGVDQSGLSSVEIMSGKRLDNVHERGNCLVPQMAYKEDREEGRDPDPEAHYGSNFSHRYEP